jgi:hypothetical protein
MRELNHSKINGIHEELYIFFGFMITTQKKTKNLGLRIHPAQTSFRYSSQLRRVMAISCVPQIKMKVSQLQMAILPS